LKDWTTDIKVSTLRSSVNGQVRCNDLKTVMLIFLLVLLLSVCWSKHKSSLSVMLCYLFLRECLSLLSPHVVGLGSCSLTGYCRRSQDRYTFSSRV
jgi:hypothetical protein